jgi:hypothetical protein
MIENGRERMRDARCGMRDAGYGIRDMGYGRREAGSIPKCNPPRRAGFGNEKGEEIGTTAGGRRYRGEK